MKSFLKGTLVMLFFSFAICFSVFAQETLTITTYYPSPYGSYRELRSQRMAIGDSYYDAGVNRWGTEIDSNADLVVEGTVGIGTRTPSGILDVIRADSGFAIYAETAGTGVGGWGLLAIDNSTSTVVYPLLRGGVRGVADYNIGVSGMSFFNTGVIGESAQGTGVIAQSFGPGSTAKGLYAYSQNNYAVHAKSDNSLAGYFEGPVDVSSANNPVIRGIRTSTATNDARTALTAQHSTTADMVDGFGSLLGFEIIDNDGTTNYIASIGGVRDGADNSGALAFNTFNAGSSLEKMRITADGNVGIGTTNPQVPLHIENNANPDGNGQEILRLSSVQTPLCGSGGKISFRNQAGVETGYIYNPNMACNSMAPGLAFGTNLNATTKMVITAGGNVGIGTQTPTLTLDIRGLDNYIGSGDSSQVLDGWRLGKWPANAAAQTWLYLSKANASVYQDLAVGALWAGGALRFGVVSDIAEITPVNPEDNLEAGDVVIIDEPKDDRVLLSKSNKPYDFKIAGVISSKDTAALIIGGNQPKDLDSKRKDLKPLAIAGRILTKVTLEKGPIKAGDPITSSSKAGYAMKATKPGYILGKSLQSFSGGKNGETSGKIWVLVNLGWFNGIEE